MPILRTSLPLLALLYLLAPACANEIRFTEAVTDPQSDHNETAGGNGVLFDSVPGSGSVTTSDEWIELVNAGAHAVDLTGYTISFNDSSPSTYVFGTSTAGTLIFSGSSSLTSFAPGDFLLLGNPPGSLNNTITLELYDAANQLVELWAIDDANASGLADEARARSVFGDLEAQTMISPLANSLAFEDLVGIPGAEGGADGPAPVPEPSSAWLLGLTTAGWIAARRRRARGAACRTRSRTPRRASDPA